MKALFKPADPHKIVVWDLETTSDWTGTIICVGIVSEDGRRGAFRSLDDAMRWAEEHGLFKYKWYAHYGGIFDHLIVLPKLLDNGWSMTRASTSAGALTNLVFRKGKHSLYLRDSSRLLPGSVASIGKAIGLPKLDVDRERMTELTWGEIVSYCLRDCDIVLQALIRLRRILESDGGGLRATLASCVSDIVRFRCVPADAWGWSYDDDLVVSNAYAGGRVEVFRKESTNGCVLDINSAYPAAMAEPLPTKLVESGYGKPPKDSSSLFVVAAEVNSTGPYGSVFHRRRRGPLKGKLLFPNGIIRGMYTLEELEGCADLGACDYVVHRWFRYESEPWLCDLMRSWYDRRRASTDEFDRYCLKILINSVSGKLIERDDYSRVTQDAKEALRAEDSGARVSIIDVGRVRLYDIQERHVGPLRHAAAAAHVTARARVKLLKALCAADEPAYCDTDSVHGRQRETSSDALGEWKLEVRYDRAEYLAPKVYRIDADGRTIVKAKGFPVPKAQDEARVFWDALAAGEAITTERTRLFSTMLKKHDFSFARDSFSRQLRGGLGKRKFDGNSSRPWTVEELSALEDA